MKYVLLFCADGDDVGRFATMSEAERADQFARVGAWFAEHRARITGGQQLAWPQSATTCSTPSGASCWSSSAGASRAGRPSCGRWR
jgi:hypothetical protein